MKKTNSISGLLLNPLERVAGMKASALGLAVVLATIILGYLSGTYFFGWFSIKLVAKPLLWEAFAVQLLSVAVVALVMYVAAMTQTRQVRFSDILGATTLTRYPLILAAIPGFFVSISDRQALVGRAMDDPEAISALTAMIVPGLIMLVFSVFATVLLYRAYRVSTGLKGARLNWSFAIGIVSAEIICNIIVFKAFSPVSEMLDTIVQ